MSTAQPDIRRKRRVLDYAERTGNIRMTCRHFGIPRSLFYIWRGKDSIDCPTARPSLHRSNP